MNEQKYYRNIVLFGSNLCKNDTYVLATNMLKFPFSLQPI